MKPMDDRKLQQHFRSKDHDFNSETFFLIHWIISAIIETYTDKWIIRFQTKRFNIKPNLTKKRFNIKRNGVAMK